MEEQTQTNGMNPAEVLNKFFDLLGELKHSEKEEDAHGPAVFKPGEVVHLVIDKVNKDGRIELERGSSIKFAAIMENVNNLSDLGKYLSSMRRGGIYFGLDCACNEPMKSFNEELQLFMKRKQAVNVDRKQLTELVGILKDGDFITSFVELIREIDPVSASEIEAIFTPPAVADQEATMARISALEAELAAMKQGMGELTAERDAALRTASVATDLLREIQNNNIQNVGAEPEDPNQPQDDPANANGGNKGGKSGKNSNKRGGRQEVNHSGGQQGNITDLVVGVGPSEPDNSQDQAADQAQQPEPVTV